MEQCRWNSVVKKCDSVMEQWNSDGETVRWNSVVEQ